MHFALKLCVNSVRCVVRILIIEIHVERVRVSSRIASTFYVPDISALGASGIYRTANAVDMDVALFFFYQAHKTNDTHIRPTDIYVVCFIGDFNQKESYNIFED